METTGATERGLLLCDSLLYPLKSISLLTAKQGIHFFGKAIMVQLLKCPFKFTSLNG